MIGASVSVNDLVSYINELQIIVDIIEHAENIIFAKDLTGIYTIANRASITYFGVESREQVIGKRDADFLPENEAQFNVEMDKEVLQTEQKKGYEKTRVTSSGIEQTYYVVKDVVRNKLGTVVGISGVVVDISEYKREQLELFKQRELTERLEAANRTKLNFIKNLSHNLRTPLMGIIGASVMNVDLEQFGPYKKDLEIFKYSSQLLLNIVNEIIDMESFISEDIKLKNSSFRLKSLITFVDKLFQDISKEQGINFTCTCDELCGEISIVSDLQRFIQLVNKLFMLCLRNTPRGKNIYVGFECRDCRDNERVCILLKVGSSVIISGDVKKRLFQAEYKEDEKFVMEHATSLGLETFVAKKITDAFGAELLYKEDDRGGWFEARLEFPRGRKEMTLTPASLQDLKVLVVDDNIINQKVLARMLERLRVRDVVVASDGLEAFNLYKENRDFDLIFMDIQMPVMNGIEATKAIRKYERDNDVGRVKILAITAFVTDEDKAECFEAGMDSFVGKPLTESVLLDTIVSMHVEGYEGE